MRSSCAGGAIRIAGNDRTRDKVMLSLIQRFPMNRLIARIWTSALDRYAQSDPD